MRAESPDDRGLFQAMVGDGRPLLLFTGVALVLAGGFAIFQSATGQFLPHDVEYLGMTAKGGPKGVGDAVNQAVVVTFMLLFALNFVITAVYFQVVPQKGS